MNYPSDQLVQALKNIDLAAAYDAVKSGADPNHVASTGETPLSLAVRGADLQMVKTLLNKGADPCLTVQGHRAPLIEAITRNDHAIIKSLVEAGADPNCSWNQRSLLGLAAERGDVELIELLVSLGADINTVDSHGETPISLAYAHADSATALLILGAKPRDAEQHLIAYLDFPTLALRPEFTRFKKHLETVTGRPGLSFMSVPGVFTAVLPADSFRESGGDVDDISRAYREIKRSHSAIGSIVEDIYLDALASDCLVYNCHDHDSRGAFIRLIPSADKFAAMAVSGLSDRPNGHSVYGMVRAFKELDAIHPFLLKGCSSKLVEVEFRDPALSIDIARRSADRIFDKLGGTRPILNWTMTDTGVCIAVDH